ncbi:MAG: hypothetical protein SFW67_04925 [Myxococcaceae bacterium]|nr:hypothetical protein [Myxococcaceae bacterium]
MLIPNKSLNNVIQGAVLRGHIAQAKADGRVTSGEMSQILSRAKAGGVTSSELAQLKELAQSSRNNTQFDAGGKAQLNKFLGRSADQSHASGRLPPFANLPQKQGLFGGVFDRVRLNSLEQHFKKDDGMIGRSEGRAILKNIFKDGNLSPTERQFLQKLAKDPNVSAAAKQDIKLLLSLMPGERLVGDLPIKLPKLPRPMPLPPSPGAPPPPVTTAPPPPPAGGTPPPPTSGPAPATGPSPSTGTGGANGTAGNSSSKWDGASMPNPDNYKMEDPKEAAQFQRDMAKYQQSMNNISLYWQTLSNVLKAQNDTAQAVGRNVR